MSVYVCNNSAADFAFKFDGDNYLLPVGKTVEIPEDAALFAFGYGGDDAAKRRAGARFGVVSTTADLAFGKLDAWLANFVFAEPQPVDPPDLSAAPSADEGSDANADPADTSDAAADAPIRETVTRRRKPVPDSLAA
jgi:hypothetical protein